MTKHRSFKSTSDIQNGSLLHVTRKDRLSVPSKLFNRCIISPKKLSTCLEDSSSTPSNTIPIFKQLLVNSDRGATQSCASSPNSTSPHDAMRYAQQNISKNLNSSFDDSYFQGADDSLIEQMMVDQQSAMMTANSVSPASPLQIPPGPHTSPAPSPHPSANSVITTTCVEDVSTTPHNLCPAVKLRVRLRHRRRRNAMCETNSLNKGLRDFLLSYVVSSLSESMTNSLSLETQQQQQQAPPYIDTTVSSSESRLNFVSPSEPINSSADEETANTNSPASDQDLDIE